MSGDVDPGTEVVEGAAGTFRRGRVTAVLTEGDQQIVDVDPEIFGQRSLQRTLGGFGCLGGRQTQSVGDPVDMGVDTDRRNAEAEAEYQIGCLSADARQIQECFFLPWNRSVVIGLEDPRDSAKLGCLGAVETGGVDGVGDLGFTPTSQLGRVVRNLKESSTRLVGDLILGSQRDHARDQ